MINAVCGIVRFSGNTPDHAGSKPHTVSHRPDRCEAGTPDTDPTQGAGSATCRVHDSDHRSGPTGVTRNAQRHPSGAAPITIRIARGFFCTSGKSKHADQPESAPRPACLLKHLNRQDKTPTNTKPTQDPTRGGREGKNRDPERDTAGTQQRDPAGTTVPSPCCPRFAHSAKCRSSGQPAQAVRHKTAT